MYKAVIFDLDGTLMDTVESIATAANLALQECGLQPHPVHNYNYYAGDGADTLLFRALADAGDVEGIHFERMQQIYHEYFKNTCTNAEPYDGICDMLDELQKRDMKLAVLSNKPHERTLDVIHETFGASMFEMVLGQQEGLQKKPAPDGAFLICDKMNVLPEECIYVGDTNVDMITGKTAGMYTVGVLWGFRDREELEKTGAMKVIATPGELVDLIQ